MFSLLGELDAAGNWAMIVAEHWADQASLTPLGCEDAAFFRGRTN